MLNYRQKDCILISSSHRHWKSVYIFVCERPLVAIVEKETGNKSNVLNKGYNADKILQHALVKLNSIGLLNIIYKVTHRIKAIKPTYKSRQER